MVVLGLRFCARALSSCGKWGPLFIAVCGPLTTAASLVAEHRLQTRRLSNYGSWAQPLRGMRDPPRPGLEPLHPASAGRLPTTAPPGKPLNFIFCMLILSFLSATCWKTVLSPLNGLDSLVKNHLSIYMKVYLWAFYSIQLVYVFLYVSAKLLWRALNNFYFFSMLLAPLTLWVMGWGSSNWVRGGIRW